MFLRNVIKHRLMEQENGAENEGGQGGGNEPSVADLQAQLKAANESNEAMKAKMDELLGETKRAKAAKREAEEQARVEAEEKAKKAGDFEQLFKSSEAKNQEWEQRYTELQNKIASEKQNGEAMRIATGLAEGANAELLSTFIAPRLKYTEEGIKILDSNGQLTVSTVEDLVSEFQNNTRYASLLKGNQSSGGGANGNGNKGGSAPKQMTRTEFEASDASARMKFVNSGGVIVD